MFFDFWEYKINEREQSPQNHQTSIADGVVDLFRPDCQMEFITGSHRLVLNCNNCDEKHILICSEIVSAIQSNVRYELPQNRGRGVGEVQIEAVQVIPNMPKAGFFRKKIPSRYGLRSLASINVLDSMFRNERGILVKPYFVSVYYAVTYPNQNVHLYLEKMDGDGLVLGELQQEIKDYPTQLNSGWNNLLEGLYTMHAEGLYFMDIKPSNVGYNMDILEGGHSKITLKWIDIDSIGMRDSTFEECQSLDYVDPYTLGTNIEETKEIKVARELFKVGLSIYEMLTGENLLIIANNKLNTGKTPFFTMINADHLLDIQQYIEEKRWEVAEITQHLGLQKKLFHFLSPDYMERSDSTRCCNPRSV